MGIEMSLLGAVNLDGSLKGQKSMEKINKEEEELKMFYIKDPTNLPYFERGNLEDLGNKLPDDIKIPDFIREHAEVLEYCKENNISFEEVINQGYYTKKYSFGISENEEKEI